MNIEIYRNITWYDLPNETIEKICRNLPLEELEKFMLVEKSVLDICENVYNDKILERENQIMEKRDNIEGIIDPRGRLMIIDKRKHQTRSKSCFDYSNPEIVELMWYIEMPAPILTENEIYPIPEMYRSDPLLFMRTILDRSDIDTSMFSDDKVKYFWSFYSLWSSLRGLPKVDMCHMLRKELAKTGHLK